MKLSEGQIKALKILGLMLVPTIVMAATIQTIYVGKFYGDGANLTNVTSTVVGTNNSALYATNDPFGRVLSNKVAVTVTGPGQVTTTNNGLLSVVMDGTIYTNNDTVVSNGMFNVFNDGTNKAYGYTRTISAADTNNDTVVSNGVFNVFNDGTNKTYAYARTLSAADTNEVNRQVALMVITNAFVAAGANVTVTTNVSGGKTVYTVAATGGTGIAATPGNGIVMSTNSGVVTIATSLVAGSNVTLSTNGSGVITIAATGGTGIAASAGTDMLLTTNSGVVTFDLNTITTNISSITYSNGVVLTNGGPGGMVVVATNSGPTLSTTNSQTGGSFNTPTNIPTAGYVLLSSANNGDTYYSQGVPANSNNVVQATNDLAAYARTLNAGTTNYALQATNDLAAYARTLNAGTTNYALQATNDLAAYARTLNAGTTNYALQATNDIASYARTLNAAATNNDIKYGLATSNGLVALVTVKSISIPLSAWYTNNDVVLPNTPATPTAFTNISSGFTFASQNSNEIHCAFSLGSGWDGSAIRVRLKAVSTGTNSIFTTNIAWRVGAYCIPPLTSYTNNLTATFIWGTNNVPPTLAYQRGNDCVTVDLTPAGTLDPTNTLYLSVRRDSAVSGAGGSAWITREATNTIALIDDVIVYYKGTNTLAMPTPNP